MLQGESGHFLIMRAFNRSFTTDLITRDASGFRGYYFTLGHQEDFRIICTGGMQLIKPTSNGPCVQNASDTVLSCSSFFSVRLLAVSHFKLCLLGVPTTFAV